ncbi:hypothetical protein SGFS_073420 [Streptomyces graminofaciens]|uniref:HTH cro/C1-type domain-containing protein n=1 Tax=Streptomyces graminofaciens TaxID=68212 RepID=A0ABM7FI54_9ACTN|nr:hypothetical protein SGFS_073420 [Streptomyces graminofaciens]
MPDELDPQVKEFAGQLRRLVDRSGLSIAAVADRTGYSKTSWERYLNGRLLAPKGAIVALAEVTGTNPVHLTTMWELAERAWSRSEMRHDMTMEAIRISQARAALGDTGSQPSAKGKSGRASRGATATPGVAGPAGVSPTVPPQAPPPGEERRPSYGSSPSRSAPSDPSAPSPSPSGSSSSPSPSSPSYGGGSGSAGTAGPARVGWGVTPSPSDRPGVASPSSSPSTEAGASASGAAGVRTPGGASVPPGVFGPVQGLARPDGGGSRPKRRVAMFFAGAVGALVLIAVAFLLTRGGGENEAGDKSPVSPTPSISTNSDLPAGVKCSGKDCDGKDPESMGCIGDLVKTTDFATVGAARVEVRYSETCGAAWARITQATQGDEVRVTVGKTKQTAAIEAAGDNIAYTMMVAVKDAGDATACATLATGEEGCTG